MQGFPTNNKAVLKFAPLSEDSYLSFSPSQTHLFSLSYSSSFAPGYYICGGCVKHLFSLLMQLSLSASITWICSKDLDLISPPVATQEEKPKQTLKLLKLNAKPQEKEETKEVRSTDTKKNNQFFYESKYPELIASMIQVKPVEISRKEGFEFIRYINDREK